jgi:signal transduction histidine kinase
MKANPLVKEAVLLEIPGKANSALRGRAAGTQVWKDQLQRGEHDRRPTCHRPANAIEWPPVITWKAIKCLRLLAFWVGAFLAASVDSLAEEGTNLLRIRSVEVNGEPVRFQPGGEVNLGSFPGRVVFLFDTVSNAVWTPLRLRCKLDGSDSSWRVGEGEMHLTIRFYNSAWDLLGQSTFAAHKDSSGWTGALETSTLTHRRETLTVPPDASRLMLVISSAGPPSTTGIYVVDNVVISRLSTNGGKPEVLLQSPFDQQSDAGSENRPPTGWERDGTHPRMAKIVEIGQYPKTKAFAIVDEDRLGHAEWHSTRLSAPSVSPNDRIVVEWNEMFSIGDSANRSAEYNTLAPGRYRFRVEDTTVFGKSTGVEATLEVSVPVAVWERPWFWALVAAIAVGAGAMIVRYVARQRLRRTMLRLQQQHALEQERLRIAQDIHDDLGSRVSQISLLSAMAQNDSALSVKTRSQLDCISSISRDLVSALYETVWAVNPENDNLDAMVNYLCETFNEFCQQAQLRCRLNISDLPKNVEVSSRSRHNVSMAAKEAMHNVIKHASASQVTVRITFVESVLTISIQDNGRGFQPAGTSSGNGLVNMKRRMEDIGGACAIESRPGEGTIVHLRLLIECHHPDSLANASDRAPWLQPLEESEQSKMRYEKISGHSGR